MDNKASRNVLERILFDKPQAYATILGSNKYPDIYGKIWFYQAEIGTVVFVEVSGLPTDGSICGKNIFGFHIHNGSKCQGTEEDPFMDVGGHYNPGNCPHPKHAGDLPPLFESDGCAWMIFYTNMFTPQELNGRTVVIHANPDNFKTQPSGKSGEKIACGSIRFLVDKKREKDYDILNRNYYQ